MKIENGHH